MIDLFKEIDFSKDIEENLELKVFIQEACKKVEQEESEHLRKIKKPELDDELLNQFVISGIPALKTENEEKFINLFKNKLLDPKNIGEKNGLVSAVAGMENGVGNQTLFMTYRTAAEAKVAFNRLNNLKFDKNHTLQCIQISELRTIIEQGEQVANGKFEVPTFSSVAEKVEPNRDEQFRDQFLVREANFVYLNWLDHLDKSAKSALATQYMTFNIQINKITFSPLGSYMAVCCSDGIRIYYGSTLKSKGFLKQYNPIDAKFSADQRFIVTFNGNQTKNRQNLILWAVEQEVKIKSYRAHSNQNLQSFQFSDDGQNLAVLTQNDVTFFTLATVQDLIKQARAPEEQQHIVKAPHVQKVAWLKSKNWIIIMCYELDYSPSTIPATRIFLYNVELKTEKKWRAWGEHAKNGQIFVSQRGDWVAIALRKFIKKGHFATSIQIGNLLKKEQGLQISSLEFKEDVGNISFDGYNNRLAVIYKDQNIKSSINLRFIVSFFQIATKNRSLQINKIGELTNNLPNRVVLASNGAFFALYNVSDDSAERGRFSFGMITRENREKGKRVFNFQFTKQNLMVNGMNFFNVDQSGRFALLGTQKGYQIWNMIGQIVTKDTLQKNIHDLQWRPRIFNKLSEEEERKMLEEQKEIRKKYELIDDKRINFLKYEKQAAKIRQKELFLEYIAKKQSWYKNFVDLRQKILGFKQFQARTDKYEIEEGFIDLQ